MSKSFTEKGKSCTYKKDGQGWWGPGRKWNCSERGSKSADGVEARFIVVVQFNHVQLFATPETVARQASLSFTISWWLLKLMSIESVMPSNHLILCFPLLLLPSTFPAWGFFSDESVLLIRQPKYWNFSFSISLSNVHSGLISFRIDWFNLAIEGTLKSLLQDHSLKASILWCSVFFMVRLSHP